jgi:D-alanyl-D-alanine carboxypeptidase
MIGPSSEYPSGGWIMAEYLAPASKVAQMPAEGMSFTLGLEPVDRDHALPPDYQPHDLTALPTSMTYLGREVLVREPTARALRALMARAKREGVQLKVLSGFRPYSHQRKLYFDALVQLGPKQNGTAMPGHSEHQLGTTVDFIGPDVRAHLNGRFGDTPEGKFLRKYAEQYGFRNSYTEENAEESGYKPEPWHWRQVSEWSGPTD